MSGPVGLLLLPRGVHTEGGVTRAILVEGRNGCVIAIHEIGERHTS